MYRNAIGVVLKSGATGVQGLTQSATSASRDSSAASFTVTRKEDKSFWVLILSDIKSGEELPLPVTKIAVPSHYKGSIELLAFSSIAIITPQTLKVFDI